MTAADASGLAALRDRPFELLKELERRSRSSRAGAELADADGEEWVGIGFRLGDESFVVAREEIREVMMLPANNTRVPGSKQWLAGLANLRGQLLPLTDLKRFLGSGPMRGGRSARVLVINGSDFPAGVVVDEVFGFRRFADEEFSPDLPETHIRCERYLAGVYRKGDEQWPVFRMTELLVADDFRDAAQA